MATPILVLGVEDIKRQNDLKVKIVEKERLAENTRANEGLQEETKSAINSALTNYARDHIKIPLSVPNYDKTRFESIVLAYNSSSESYLLSEKDLKQCLSIFRSTDEKPPLVTKNLMLSSVTKFKSEYHYLFSMLYHFDKTGGGDFDRLLNLPNIVRRFMEAFGGIMIPL
jgi:hypothetical protein